MTSQQASKQPVDASAIEARAVQLLQSLKGIQSARVETDARGRITRVELVPVGVDDRAAMRNAQSALMAVLGQNIDVNTMAIAQQVSVASQHATTVIAEAASVAFAEPDPMVVEIGAVVRRSELHEAARVAFDTLRAAQSSFHGYQFEGAELVRMSGYQYVVVALKRGEGARYCGAASVTESVAAASARALMNAVGVAAMGATRLELLSEDEYEALKA